MPKTNWIFIMVLIVMAVESKQGKAQAPENNDHTIIYRLNDSKFSIVTSYSSGPDQRTKSSFSMSIVIDTTGLHNYPQAISFLVVELKGFDSLNEPVPLSPDAKATPQDQQQISSAKGRDKVMAIVWFATPWEQLQERDFKLEAPVNDAVMKKLHVIEYVTYHTGHHLSDAISLLGDLMLPETMRMAIASRLSHEGGKRYQYRTDQGSWSVPQDVPAFLPDATDLK